MLAARIAILFLVGTIVSHAFSNNGLVISKKPSITKLSMVFGPRQALAIEKRKNPQQAENTIQGLMKAKKLSRAQAEKRYGEFLVDPDGFALNAAAEERREAGYKDWIEQAVAKSDDPEATQQRIDEFTARNKKRGIAIMTVLSASILYYSYTHPFVPVR